MKYIFAAAVSVGVQILNIIGMIVLGNIIARWLWKQGMIDLSWLKAVING